MVRWILSSAVESGSGGGGRGDGFNSIDYTALAMTLTRHVSLTLRLIIMAPQSTHFRGGCFLLLRRLLLLEQTLCLGRLPLTAGHLYVHSSSGGGAGISDSSDECSINKSGGGAVGGGLSRELPIPLLDLQELKELKQENLEIDALGMFRRAFTSQKITDRDPKAAFHVLTEITNMSQFLMQALASDVHDNMPDDIHRLLAFSSTNRLLHPEISVGLGGISPAILEDTAVSLPSGIPTVRATHWQATKAAMLFMARKPKAKLIETEIKTETETETEEHGSEVTPHQIDTNKAVITAKMALQQQEPSSNFVLLRNKTGDVHKQVGVRKDQ